MRAWTPILVVLAMSCGGQAYLGPAMEEDKSASGLNQRAGSPGAPMDDVMEGGFADELEAAEEAPAAVSKPSPKREKNKGARAEKDDDADGDGAAAGEGEGGEEARTRAWFPETFLWQPLVETGADGTAEVSVRVPDRLTTWRVLGLAHTEGGQQTGGTHSFASVQAVYVDPVLPNHLYAGDRVDLPVQAVNTSATARDLALDVRGDGSLGGGLGAAVKLAPGGTVVKNAALEARFPGQGVVQARLGTADKVVRSVAVRPVGKPHVHVAGGSLTQTRSFTLRGPAGADPRSQELSVQVYPGSLAVLQAELDRLGAGGAVADPAYGFAVTSTLERLAAASGAEVEPRSVRRVRQQSWQRLIREAGFDPDARRLVALVGALREVEDHELAVQRRDIWAQRLVDDQRADGTFAPASSGTVQALVVQTATAAWALPDGEDYDTPRAKARSALERLVRQVDDPFTAAVVAGSGLIEGPLQDELVQDVLDAVEERTDGSRSLPSPGRVHSAFGGATRAEFLAWARMALDERDDLVWRDDLVAELMSGYGASGFGAGRGDLVALTAVSEALPSVSSPVEVVLLLDDEEVARGSLDPAQPRTPLTLSAAPQAEDPRYTLQIEGAAPGLAWTAKLRSWTPWKAPADTGVEASWVPARLQAGKVGTATLTLSAPGGSRVTARAGLPAGTWVDLDGLRRNPAVVEASQDQDTLTLRLRELGPAEILEVPVSVQPSFGGDFATGPLSLQVRGPRSIDLDLPPARWRVQ